MCDTDEILTLVCDYCDRTKRLRVSAGGNPKVWSRCCRYFMRVLTRTTLSGESPPYRAPNAAKPS